MRRHRAFKKNCGIPSAPILSLAVLGVLMALASTATAQNPVPFTNQPLVPDAIAPGGAAFTLTVNGAGFVPASTVNWNGSPRVTTFVSGAQLTANIPASDIATASTASVTVVNPGPGGGVSNIQYFSIAVATASFSFQPVQAFNANEQFDYSAIAIADLNGDGIPDVVIASQNASSTLYGLPTGDGSVEIFLGNGDGTFQSPVSYSSGGGDPNSLAIADVNGDGKLDIAVGNEGNQTTSGGVGVLLGNGDGTFQNVSVVSTLYAQSVVVADVNGDGKLDVIMASANQDFIGGGLADVLLGNGDGTFQPATVYSSGASGAGYIAVADVNGDGKLDLIMTGPCPTTGFSCAGSPYPDAIVSVLLGNGNGTFQSPLIYDSGGYAFGGYPSGGVIVTDVNADGRPDLLVGNCQLSGGGCQNATVAVLLGNGNGTFQPAAIYYAGTNTGSASSIAAADMNMDGKVDVVATTWYGSLVGVLLGNGNGTFQPVVASNFGAAYPNSIAIADLNGDGKPDAALVNCGVLGVNVCEGSLGVLLNESGSVQTPTTTTVASSLNPAIYGQTVTLSATVSSATGLPTGIVTFYQGSTAVGSATLVNRSTSISVSTLAAGSQPITAVYQGCSAFGLSTSAPLSDVVSPAASTTSLASSANPARPGSRITYTATVTSQFGGITTGTVTFLSGSQTLGTVPLSGKGATLTTSFASLGNYSISATYNGDANNRVSTSTLSQGINTPTTTALSSSLNPSIYGQAVSYTATVTSSFGTPPNGETVNFQQGSTVLGTGTLTGGSASFTTSSLRVGTDAITAVYVGNSNFGERSSQTLKQVVSRATSTTVLTSSQNPSDYEQPVTFTATVSPQFTGTPTGSVTFYNGTATAGSATLVNGVASYKTAKLAVGNSSITAEYKGSASFDTSTSAALSQVVNQSTTTTTLASSLNPSSAGQSVTFTATLAAQFGGTVTGPVVFADGTTTLKTVNLSGNEAKYTTSTLAAGTHNITATYQGITDFRTSSAALTQSVE